MVQYMHLSAVITGEEVFLWQIAVDFLCILLELRGSSAYFLIMQEIRFVLSVGSQTGSISKHA